MECLGPATLQEVLDASPKTRGSQKTVEHYAKRGGGFWKHRLTSIVDIAFIKAQFPLLNADGSGRFETIAEMYPDWKDYLTTADPEDKLRYEHVLSVTRRGIRWEHWPVLIEEQGRQVHDGKHRLFALYEHLTLEPHRRRGSQVYLGRQRPMPYVEVLWNQPGLSQPY